MEDDRRHWRRQPERCLRLRQSLSRTRIDNQSAPSGGEWNVGMGCTSGAMLGDDRHWLVENSISPGPADSTTQNGGLINNVCSRVVLQCSAVFVYPEWILFYCP